jgi:hypothetical protein
MSGPGYIINVLIWKRPPKAGPQVLLRARLMAC